ncbi:phage shock protein PspC (stress-responsive transcriptional regulator) [Flavobacterium arsenatis]|uniref:Phage shock protein PspC (Stress-responsive transcriptional regulator) n=1 Tax=Flavobacterium arsenatis TaxID=1484332 RepID=A0ABU1TPW3_9FLAO|nr:PspC domain-containing protein [Flavobacterium arsenatis]MDR6967993.1 phage shock protein PspC (stress-responsive transcriptional regulator) [Flavobacterium arsenatis]
MNKTVNINLGGMFFHIDEDAYQKLTRYFEAIKRSLSNSNGQDEIIKDIEMRIAELFAEKHTSDKQVINLRELDEVIAVMGQPEDYRIDNEEAEFQQKSTNFDYTSRPIKKLYRDKDGGMIGGVMAGLGHYFGIDKVWLRVILLILVFVYGTGLLAYVILWIVMPEAVTTSEKLEMTGEPVNISNIEKKVREEFDNVSEKFKNVNYDKMGNQVKTGADRIVENVGNVFMSIFKIFAKILGVMLILSGVTILFFLLVGIFTLGTTAFIEFPWSGFVEAGNYTDYPVWTFGLLMLFSVGIPFFYLMVLGFKLLIPDMKSLGNVFNYTFLALWIISIALIISLSIKQATQFAFEGKSVKKEVLQLNPTDTLQIKFKYNESFANDIHDYDNYRLVQDSTNTEMIFSSDVRIRIMKTDEKQPYIQIVKEADGESLSAAKQSAEKIQYGYKLQGNQLILDNYLLTEASNKFRNQEVEINLYLPVGILFKADEAFRDRDNSDDEFFNLHHSSADYLYRVDSSKVKCLTCPADENEFQDVENEDLETTSDTIKKVILEVNGKEIIRTETVTSKKKGLRIDENGVIIKNK